MNQISSKEKSARYALRLRQIQEERALQQRALDAERQALAKELINLRETYKLLEQQIRKKAVDYCESTINTSSAYGSHSPTHGQAADRLMKPHHPITQLGMQMITSMQPVCYESITDRQQLCRIQQRVTRAFPTENSQEPHIVANKVADKDERIIDIISIVSLDTFSAEHPPRTGGCVNSSHPDSCDDLQRQYGSFPVSVARNNKNSTRIALQIQLQEEKRAIQQRDREAIAEENRLILKNYHRLKEQLRSRRHVNKRSQFVADMEQNVRLGGFDKNEPSSADNELPAENRAAQTVGEALRKRTSIVRSNQQQNQLQQSVPMKMECLAVPSQSGGIQQRHTSAFPELIPKRYEIIDRNASISNNIILSAPCVTLSRLLAEIYLNRVSAIMSWLPSSYDAKLIASSSGLQTTSRLSVWENRGSFVALRMNKGFVMNGQQLRAPPRFVAPIVPDPGPPPSRFGDLARRTEVNLRTYSDILSNPLLVLMNSNVLMYNIRSDKLKRGREYQVRDGDMVVAWLKANDRKEAQETVLHYSIMEHVIRYGEEISSLMNGTFSRTSNKESRVQFPVVETACPLLLAKDRDLDIWCVSMPFLYLSAWDEDMGIQHLNRNQRIENGCSINDHGLQLIKASFICNQHLTNNKGSDCRDYRNWNHSNYLGRRDGLSDHNYEEQDDHWHVNKKEVSSVGARGNRLRISNVGNHYNRNRNDRYRIMVKLEPLASVTGGSMLPLGALPAI